jgi:hypothetical protein
VKPIVPVLTLFAATALPGDRVAYQPAEGSTLAKTFTWNWELELEDLSVIVDGTEIDPSMMGGEFMMSMVYDSEIKLLDTFGAMADGRLAKLERRFETLGSDMSFSVEAGGESDDQEMPGSSELEGEAVVFTWNADEQDYDVAWAEGSSGDDELLEGLEEEADLRWMLPAGEVSVGEGWEVDTAALRHLIMPGGDMRILPEGEEMDEDMMRMMENLGAEAEELYAKIMAGRMTATLTAIREEGDSRLAEIALDVEIESSNDFASMAQEIITTAIEESGEDIPVEFSVEMADVELQYDAQGTLLWDLGTGVVRALDLSGDFSIAIDAAFTVNAMGEEHAAEFSIEMGGTSEFEVAAE